MLDDNIAFALMAGKPSENGHQDVIKIKSSNPLMTLGFYLPRRGRHPPFLPGHPWLLPFHTSCPMPATMKQVHFSVETGRRNQMQ